MRFLFQMICFVLLLISCRANKNSTLDTVSSKGAEMLAPGSYFGFLRLRDSTFKIPLNIDLIRVKNRTEQANYQGVFKLSLGDHDSDEFSTDYREAMVLDKKSGEFFVSGTDGQWKWEQVQVKSNVVISGKLIHPSTQQEVGDFIGIKAENPTQIQNLLQKIFPDKLVMNALSGKYGGICQEKPTELQLDLVRWSRSTNVSTQQFLKNYRSSAVFAQEDTSLCADKSLCAKGLYSDVEFDISLRQIQLIGRPRLRICEVKHEGILCDGCLLTAKTEPHIKQRLTRPQRTGTLKKSFSIGRSPDYAGAVNGEFYGYLFHEATQMYQMVRLKVDATEEKDEGMKRASVKISGVATLFYGDRRKNEFTVYKFDPKYYTDFDSKFVFNGPGEAILQVEEWTEDSIKAVWYGKTFGRVGTLELLRDKMPSLAAPFQKIIRPISGVYEARGARFELTAQSNISVSDQDFFPIASRGWIATDKSTKLGIQSVMFDVYTQQLGIEMADGQILKGKVNETGVHMKWRDQNQYGSSVQPLRLEQYTYAAFPELEKSAHLTPIH